jgi:phage shock protein PspC (stress-responsive transcriptional regulator)
MTSNPSGPTGPERPGDVPGRDVAPEPGQQPTDHNDGGTASSGEVPARGSMAPGGAVPPGGSIPPGGSVPPSMPGGVPPMPGSVPQPESNSFFNWFRSLGMPRGSDRWIGGVASGVGHRTGLDPVLVRGLFILVALFGGFGVLLYGLAWALLPEADGRIHAEEAGRGHWTAGMTGALIATILGLFDRPFGFFRDGDWEFSAYLWAVVWLGALGYFIYWLATRNRNTPPAPGASGYPSAGYPAPAAPAGPYGRPGPAAPGDTVHGTPSANLSGQPAPGSTTTSFGPNPTSSLRSNPTAPTSRLGSSPAPAGAHGGFGSAAGMAAPPLYTPRPAVPAPPRPRRRGPSGVSIALTLGTAMVAAGVVLALPLVQGIDPGIALLPVAVAAALLCIGSGIVVLGVRGRTSGILGFLAAVGIVLSLVTTAGVQWTTANYSIGTQTTWTSESGAPPGEGYSIVASQGRVDLSGLAAGSIVGPIIVPVNTVASNVEIVLPAAKQVEVQSSLAMGNIEYPGTAGTQRRSGLWQPATFTINDDGSLPDVILQIRGAASNVEIVEAPERGSSS